jgi:phosphate transport system substrate-binding protein
MRWLALLVLAACGPAESPNEAPADKPTIRVAGEESITARLLPALTQRYESLQDVVAFDISSGGASQGFNQLVDGNVDLAASSRPSIPAEREQAKAALELERRVQKDDDEDWDLENGRHIVGVDVVAVSVHPSNPISSMTYDQVIGIFCTRQVDNWNFLGLDDAPIEVLTRDPSSGTRTLFEDFFCGPRGINPRISVRTSADISAELAKNPNVITFVSLSEREGKVLSLRAQAEGQSIAPSQKNILRGQYPLYHDLYLYTQWKPKPEVDAFLKWIETAPGQEVVDEAGYVPLFYRPERADEPRPLRETIHFEAGKVEPNQHSEARLHLLIDELQQRTGESRHIILEGYADNQEADAMSIASKRAMAVQKRLEVALPGTYFEIIPRGTANPLGPNTTPYGRMMNRRVQIYLADEENIDERDSPKQFDEE